MAQRLPTVEIETENGPVLINRSDFNPDLHKLSQRSQDDLATQIARAAGQGQPVAAPLAPPAPVEPVPAAQDVPPVAEVEPAAPPAPVEPVPAPAPAPGVSADQSFMVTKQGKKHFVIGQDGQKIDAEGIDPKGYDSDQAAWDAILKRGK